MTGLPGTRSLADERLLMQLTAARTHVLSAVDGLTEDQLGRSFVPSGWTIASLLNHLAFDDEMFWISAVLGADPRAIDDLHNGWASRPMTGMEAVDLYKREIERSDSILWNVDLNVPPRWWPPAETFDGPPMPDGREVVFRVLTETSTHAGHLDIVRELIDGHQHLVVA